MISTLVLLGTITGLTTLTNQTRDLSLSFFNEYSYVTLIPPCICFLFIVLQMIVGIQDSLRAIENKMTARFDKMEERLVSLEEKMATQSGLVSKNYLLQTLSGIYFQKFGRHFLRTNKGQVY